MIIKKASIKLKGILQSEKGYNNYTASKFNEYKYHACTCY